MQYTDKQLLDRVQSLPSFKGWPKGVLDIWVRSKADRYDRFDDKVYTYDCRSGKPRFIMVCTGTSNPGRGALQNFWKYNKDGAAVLKSERLIYDSHKHGRHKRDYNSYRQAKPFPHHRDNNGNRKAEEIGPVRHEIGWFNVHKAGIWSKFIGWWSAGCLVRNVRRQWNRWIGWMNRQGNPPLSVVILKEF